MDDVFWWVRLAKSEKQPLTRVNRQNVDDLPFGRKQKDQQIAFLWKEVDQKKQIKIPRICFVEIHLNSTHPNLWLINFRDFLRKEKSIRPEDSLSSDF